MAIKVASAEGVPHGVMPFCRGRCHRWIADRVRSSLVPAVDHLRDVKGVAVIELDEKDVIRHELVTRVIAAFKDIEENRPPFRKGEG